MTEVIKKRNEVSHHIALIEDDPFLGPSLEAFLIKKGFEVRLWSRPLPFIEEISVLNNFDLMVLDLILPEISGEKVLEKVRNIFPSFPILILTAKDKIECKKECFELGADDYLVKPFDVLELDLRIRALLRRVRPAKQIEKIGDILVDMTRGVIIKDDEEKVLSRRTWDLLLYFLRNRGRIIPSYELLDNVWRQVTVNEETLRSYIKELRRIIPKKCLKTFRGRGYLLE